ncbi:MAG: exodeoxyribonuclease VII small subunit [Acidobacteriota bacterium]
MAAKKKKTEEPSFEDALTRLESIVDELEGGELTLERSLELFEEGVVLGQRCNQQLDAAESKITVLIESARGRVDEVELEEAPEDDPEPVATPDPPASEPAPKPKPKPARAAKSQRSRRPTPVTSPPDDDDDPLLQDDIPF